jgi:uncharacterized protein
MTTQNRIILVDALRGFALLGIVLIHCIEHLDFFRLPDVHFVFSSATDLTVMDTVFFLISGKAYSIFALMFGLSFFIQINRQEVKGIDFRPRFAWRLTILLILGFIHSLFYKGDILHLYAILGFILIMFYKVPTKYLIAIIIILLLQIPLLYNLIMSFTNPKFVLNQSFGTGYDAVSIQTYSTGTVWDVIQFNVWKGREMVWAWFYYNGRYMQLIALFLIGLIVGRNGYFQNIEKYKKNAKIILAISFAVLLIMFAFEEHLKTLNFTENQKLLLIPFVHSYTNLVYTSVIIFIFVFLYTKFKASLGFELLASFGKMSLSNYIFQAMTGVIFFFGFGLGMYRYMGSTWSLIFGLVIATLQMFASRWWNKHFYYGPLEWLWRALTFMDFKIKFKRELN